MSVSATIKNKFKEMTDEQKSVFYLKLMAVRRKKLVKLSEAQNHRCCYCGCKTWLYEMERTAGLSKGQMATIEHVVAQTHGGTDNFFNTVMCCSRCNTLRGCHEDAFEFFSIVSSEDGVRKFKQFRIKMGLEEQRQKAQRDIIRHQKRKAKQETFAMWLGILFFYFPALNEEFSHFL